MDGHHEHTPQAIKERLNAPQENHVYLKEWVYGGIDGVVTTFAIVSGVMGAGLSPGIILILGLANLIGDGFSMAAGCYSSTKAEKDNYDRLRHVEHTHIRDCPEGEREEIRQIFAAKGFEGDILNDIVDTITQRKETWINVMMAEEYGLSSVTVSPIRAALHTFFAFALCGIMPLLPFLLFLPHSFALAGVLSGATFFAIGAFKSRWSVKSWWYHGGETFAVGMTAAGLAFIIGYALEAMI